jgi:site-specific DNA recombinase
MARNENDLPVYDPAEQGVDQDIVEVPLSSIERNASLARYKGNKQPLAARLNSADGLNGTFEPEQPNLDRGFAVIYLRVSTEEQAKVGGTAEGYSIPYQREACLAKAKAMGVVVVGEYVDAGHSAKSANRPELKRMLRELGPRAVKYVIVHKIDRLARNKRDDFIINEAITEAGAALVSVVDLVDDTPQGRFNYTIQAGLAQLYVDNLAVEVMKGLTTKVKSGGTPYRVPIGYLNKRRIEGVADIRWVEVDPERAPLITWAFEQYETGNWSISRLRKALTDKGFTTRQTRKYPGKTLSVNGLHKILTNPYYAGIVPFKGAYYPGTHTALVDTATWLRVQDVLRAHNAAGEKDRTHAHYLKGSLFCGECGSRLVFSRNRGRGGVYDYFFCIGRRFKRTSCVRKAVHVQAVEAGVEDWYRRFEVQPHHVKQIQAGVSHELTDQREQAAFIAEQAKKRLAKARNERELVLGAHYAGAIPVDMLRSEMDRLTREISAAELELQAATASVQDIEAQLHRALHVASTCSANYQEALPPIRRLMNQGFFTKLYVDMDGGIERADLTEPFAALLPDQEPATAQTVPDAPEAGPASETPPGTDPKTRAHLGGADVSERTSPRAVLKTILKNESPGQVLLTRGSNMTTLAEAEGFEPPVGFPTVAFKAETSKLCTHLASTSISKISR